MNTIEPLRRSEILPFNTENSTNKKLIQSVLEKSGLSTNFKDQITLKQHLRVLNGERALQKLLFVEPEEKQDDSNG